MARPSEHLIVNPDGRLTTSASGNGRFRPSIDWFFDSATASFVDRHVAIVLSGMMSDGVRTLPQARRRGSLVYVQEPATCRFSQMPCAAIAAGCADVIMAPEEMPDALSRVFACRDLERERPSWQTPFGDEDVARED